MTVATPDLKHVRIRLLEQRAVLADRHARVNRDLGRSSDPLVADSPDRAIQVENDQVLERIDDAVRDDIAAVDRALMRLDQGQYGICVKCQGAIESARLLALPQAITCVHCASA